jgi:hypothetical protein
VAVVHAVGALQEVQEEGAAAAAAVREEEEAPREAEAEDDDVATSRSLKKKEKINIVEKSKCPFVSQRHSSFQLIDTYETASGTDSFRGE